MYLAFCPVLMIIILSCMPTTIDYITVRASGSSVYRASTSTWMPNAKRVSETVKEFVTKLKVTSDLLHLKIPPHGIHRTSNAFHRSHTHVQIHTHTHAYTCTHITTTLLRSSMFWDWPRTWRTQPKVSCLVIYGSLYLSFSFGTCLCIPLHPSSLILTHLSPPLPLYVRPHTHVYFGKFPRP